VIRGIRHTGRIINSSHIATHRITNESLVADHESHMAEPIVVFATTSDIEASVGHRAASTVTASRAFACRATRKGIWPMAVNILGEIRIAVPEMAAEDCAAHHREPSRGRGVARDPPARRVRRAADANRLSGSAIAVCSSTRSRTSREPPRMYRAV
jgi:hypothetical protein